MSISANGNLEAAEEAVCEIIKTTAATMKELESTPNCDPVKLKNLATEFIANLGIIRSMLSGHPLLAPEKAALPEEDEEKFRDDFNRKSTELRELLDALGGEISSDAAALLLSLR